MSNNVKMDITNVEDTKSRPGNSQNTEDPFANFNEQEEFEKFVASAGRINGRLPDHYINIGEYLREYERKNINRISIKCPEMPEIIIETSIKNSFGKYYKDPNKLKAARARLTERES